MLNIKTEKNLVKKKASQSKPKFSVAIKLTKPWKTMENIKET